MWYLELNLERVKVYILESIQQILEDQNLWPSKKLRLEYFKLKYTCYIEKAKCKEYIKAKYCELCSIVILNVYYKGDVMHVL